jgi:single-stranded DNA-binding protein
MTTNGKPHFLNSVHFTVRVGTPPEKLTSAAGNPWARARVALSMGKGRDGRGYRPNLWLTAKAFGRDGDDTLVNALAALVKGSLVTVSGRLAYDEYETQAGERRSELSVLISELVPFENGPTAEAAHGEYDPPDEPF